MALRRCPGCGAYTLGERCPGCGGPTERAGPARYSPEDHYGSYRRALKRQGREGASGGVDQGPANEEE